MWRDLRRIAGLGVTAVAVGGAYVLGGFLPRLELLLAPAAAATVAAGFWLGLKAARAAGPLRRLRPAVGGAAAVAALLVLPAGLRWAWLRRELAAVPVPADAAFVAREVHFIRWEPWPRCRPPYSLRYVTRQSFDHADRFLRHGAATAGWDVRRRTPEHGAPLSTGEPARVALNAGPVFQRPTVPAAARLRIYTFDTGRRWVTGAVFDAGAERWVWLDAEFDEPPDALRGLSL